MRSYVVAAVLATAALAGCNQTEETAAGPQADDVTLSVTQWLPDEGSRDALLRIGNESDRTLVVTGAGLEWSGYGDFVRPQDSEIAPGGTLDLTMRLPRERCGADDGDGTPKGVVRTTEGTVTAPLTDSGGEFLRRLWSGRCFRQTFADQVSIAYGPTWRPGTAGSLHGDLLLRRRGGSEAVTPVRGRGSVLYGFEIVEPVVSRPAVPLTRLPVRISPGNRCDEHAIGQATAPYTFRLYVRVGDGDPGPVVVTPPQRVQQQAAAMLQRHCAQG